MLLCKICVSNSGLTFACPCLKCKGPIAVRQPRTLHENSGRRHLWHKSRKATLQLPYSRTQLVQGSQSVKDLVIFGSPLPGEGAGKPFKPHQRQKTGESAEDRHGAPASPRRLRGGGATFVSRLGVDLGGSGAFPGLGIRTAGEERRGGGRREPDEGERALLGLPEPPSPLPPQGTSPAGLPPTSRGVWQDPRLGLQSRHGPLARPHQGGSGPGSRQEARLLAPPPPPPAAARARRKRPPRQPAPAMPGERGRSARPSLSLPGGRRRSPRRLPIGRGAAGSGQSGEGKTAPASPDWAGAERQPRPFGMFGSPEAAAGTGEGLSRRPSMHCAESPPPLPQGRRRRVSGEGRRGPGELCPPRTDGRRFSLGREAMWKRSLVLSAPGKVILHGEHAVVHGKVGPCWAPNPPPWPLHPERPAPLCAGREGGREGALLLLLLSTSVLSVG